MKLFLFILIISLVSSFYAVACELKVGFQEFPPYFYKDDSGKLQGIDVDLFKSLALVIHCDVHFMSVAFDEGLKLLKDGKIDAMSQLSMLWQRKLTINFVGPIRNEKISLITIKDVSEEISELKDISHLPYIFAKGKSTYLGDEFNKLYQSEPLFSDKFVEVDSSQPLIDLVFKGRVTGVFEESNFNAFQVKNVKQYQNLKKHPLTLNTGDVYLGFSKKTISQSQLKLLNQYFQKE
ncbi:MAG: transporter substrate-binding domain-containing protein [Colwellia sp.]|nr:transporter substrate-binding domain-containing protein [Colwellia sp.]